MLVRRLACSGRWPPDPAARLAPQPAAGRALFGCWQGRHARSGHVFTGGTGYKHVMPGILVLVLRFQCVSCSVC